MMGGLSLHRPPEDDACPDGDDADHQREDGQFGRDMLDAIACSRCGGRSRVLAYLTDPKGRPILEHLALPSWPAKPAPAQGPPQSAW